MNFKSPFPEIKAITKKYASCDVVVKTTVYAFALLGGVFLLLLIGKFCFQRSGNGFIVGGS